MKYHSKSLKLIKRPPTFKKVAKGILLSFFLSIIFLIILPWQQTASGIGKVIAYSPNERQQDISAPIDGRLGKWYVQEGSFVKKGDLIIEIFDNDPDILSNLRLEREAISHRYQAAQQAMQTAKLNVDRQQELYQHGISAKRTYEQAKIDYANYASEVANIKAELARIDVRLARQHSQRVTAPIDGTILRRFAGQDAVQVKAGDMIAQFVPETSSRAVELWVSSNDVPLIVPGDIVRLQFEGWPAIQFSGWPSVAVGTFGGKVAIIDAASDAQGKFRILVVPGKDDHWPEPKYLRQGVRVNGWVLLRRVPLWYELWRRFNGFPSSQSAPR